MVTEVVLLGQSCGRWNLLAARAAMFQLSLVQGTQAWLQAG